MAKKIRPVIKWTGSKGPAMPYIYNLFPNHGTYERFVDPFVGGGSTLPYAADGVKILANDIIPVLKPLWELIRISPGFVSSGYYSRWNKLQLLDKDYYYVVRERFNKQRNPVDFLFLTRTCYNGLIRFNGNNEFNVSFHHARPGIHPHTLSSIIFEWSRYIANATFFTQDYVGFLQSINISGGDFIFLDPPYVGTKGQYQSGASRFDYSSLVDLLDKINRVGAKWLLTLGANDENPIPDTVYKNKVYGPELNSSLSRLKKKPTYASDVIYLNY